MTLFSTDPGRCIFIRDDVTNHIEFRGAGQVKSRLYMSTYTYREKCRVDMCVALLPIYCLAVVCERGNFACDH